VKIDLLDILEMSIEDVGKILIETNLLTLAFFQSDCWLILAVMGVIFFLDWKLFALSHTLRLFCILYSLFQSRGLLVLPF
jgi:hypothetical protein